MNRTVLVMLRNDDIAKALAAAEILQMGIHSSFYCVRVIAVYELGVKRPGKEEIKAVAASNITHGSFSAGTADILRPVRILAFTLWRDIVGAFLRLPTGGAENRRVSNLEHINRWIDLYTGVRKNIGVRRTERGHIKTPFENNLLLYQVEPSGKSSAGTGGCCAARPFCNKAAEWKVAGGIDREPLRALPPFSGGKPSSSKAAGMRAALRLSPQVALASPQCGRLRHKEHIQNR